MLQYATHFWVPIKWPNVRTIIKHNNLVTLYNNNLRHYWDETHKKTPEITGIFFSGEPSEKQRNILKESEWKISQLRNTIIKIKTVKSISEEHKG